MHGTPPLSGQAGFSNRAVGISVPEDMYVQVLKKRRPGTA